YTVLSYVSFNPTPTTPISTLSLHDALPICQHAGYLRFVVRCKDQSGVDERGAAGEREGVDGFVIDQRESEWESGVARLRRPHVQDRKSTRLNSSHQIISYAVFCLKKKKNNK